MLCNVIETSVSKGVYLLKACMCLLAEANWCCTIESFRPQVEQRIINVVYMIIQASGCTADK